MMRTNRSVIVQCRLSSTRLPQKALKDLCGKPILAWVLDSMKKVKADSYFVATDFESYEKLKPICEQFGFKCFAGELNDVLKRFCDLITENKLKTIIRATADNPFLFYEAAEESVKEFENLNKGKLHCDYLTFTGLPHGSGVEIFSAESLLKAASQTSDSYDHEHVGPALYKHQDKFNCSFIPSQARYNHPELRTTIDTYSDYLRAIQIANYIGEEKSPFSCEQIIEACNSQKVKNPIILIPSVKKGNGTGHLRRCLEIALKNKWFIYIPKDKTLEETENLLSQYEKKGLSKNFIIDELPDESYKPIIFTDIFAITQSQIKNLSNAKSLIGIDEGSAYLENFDYLLDIIPPCEDNRKVNFFEPNFMQKPKNVKSNLPNEENLSKGKILVCLGGEDPQGFSIPVVKILREIFPSAEISLILSDVQKAESFFNEKNINVLPIVDNLKEKLFEYDLVITHYGLTAFEAQNAGCAVILLPTSKLHLKLAKKYNFSFVEIISKDSLENALKSKNLIKKIEKSESEEIELSEFLKKLSQGSRNSCPICRKSSFFQDEILERNKTKTYRRCNSCKMIYLSWSIEPEKKYEKSYFFDEYKKQYGKTYTQDFDSIKKQGFRRLSEIKSVAGKLKNKSILDIGCAYGPFLSAANDFEMNPFGTDISQEAVDYVQNILRIPASSSVFPQINTTDDFGISQFDIVTMWYVIEHFKNLDSVLRKVNDIVKKGGCFAFSTPSGEGVSAKLNTKNFYEKSPSDHFSIWEPSHVQNILKKYGFKVVKIVSTGHHPERFPTIKDKNIKEDSLQWNLTLKKSQILKLGDTMEIYCKKI